jgi:hypothetical protein
MLFNFIAESIFCLSFLIKKSFLATGFEPATGRYLRLLPEPLFLPLNVSVKE